MNYAKIYQRIIKNFACRTFYNKILEAMNLDYNQFFSMMFNFYESIDKAPEEWMRLLYFVTLILISDSKKYKNFLALTRFYILDFLKKRFIRFLGILKEDFMKGMRV